MISIDKTCIHQSGAWSIFLLNNITEGKMYTDSVAINMNVND